MLEAKRTDNNQIVKLWDMDDDAIRQLMHEIKASRDLMTCFVENCGCSMHVKALDSSKVVAHFARYPNTGNDNHPAGGESEEHMKVKSQLAAWLHQKYPRAEITTEKTLVVGEGGYRETRRVDVFVTFPDGSTEAHEVQRSSQNTAKTERRTRDYGTAGVTRVVWWWMGKAENQAVKEWCIDNCEFYGVVTVRLQRLMGKLIPDNPEFRLYNCEQIQAERRREAEEKARKYAYWRQKEQEREEKRKKEEAERIRKEQERRAEIEKERAQKEEQERRDWKQKEDKQIKERTPQDWVNSLGPPAPQMSENPISGPRLTTRFGPNWTGTAVVVAHDTVTGLYQTSSGLWWKLVNGELVTP